MNNDNDSDSGSGVAVTLIMIIVLISVIIILIRLVFMWRHCFSLPCLKQKITKSHYDIYCLIVLSHNGALILFCSLGVIAIESYKQCRIGDHLGTPPQTN